MSTSPESESSELNLDLDLAFLPAWAQKPAENKYAQFEGGGERSRGDRGDRRERRPDRPPGARRPEGRGPGQGPRGDRGFGGPGRDASRFRSQDRGRRPESAPPPAPPLEINVSFIPEEKGVESLARQIRLTGRAYPLFDIGYLVLKKPDRYLVRFSVIKKPDGQVAQALFVCALDETLWLSEQEAVDYVLGKHFATFYQSERTPADPPKGTYTFVAQCGMSGSILGPPNYHDYQNKLRKLHTERFSRMPFEAFKARIKIVRDEAVVKKWLEDQSWRTEYVCLNVPETLKLGTREEVEQHFRQTHLADVIKSVESHALSGPVAQSLPNPPLQRLVRRAWDEQMRFPLKTVNVLSQQFAGHGLQFFKVNKTVTHVAVARPRYLDLELTPVSQGVQRIVDFIQATPSCTRRKLFEALVPTPAQPSAPPIEGAPPAEPPQSPEMAAVISDLHWLIHQGHVVEYANGSMELAKKPFIKPTPPKPEAAPAATQSPTEATAIPGEPTPSSEESVPEGQAAGVTESETAGKAEPPPENPPAATAAVEGAPQPNAVEGVATEVATEKTPIEPAEGVPTMATAETVAPAEPADATVGAEKPSS